MRGFVFPPPGTTPRTSEPITCGHTTMTLEQAYAAVTKAAAGVATPATVREAKQAVEAQAIRKAYGIS